jgi:DNA polymerase-3 subunit alpha
MSDFVHLHTHSHYSLLAALPKIPDLIKAAKDAGMTAIALTDNGNLYGAIEFYKDCQKAGIKPILGSDLYMAARSRHDKQHGVDNKWSRLVLLAKTDDGYKNLIRIVTAGHLEGFYYKPRVDKEVLRANVGGLIAILPSFSGEVQQALKNNNEAKALDALNQYIEIFGKEDTYLEITHHPEIENHGELTKRTIEFARKHDIQLVAAQDVYYLSKEDKPARTTLLSIQSGGDSSERKFGNDGEFHFITGEEAEKFFANTPDAIANTKKIADQCEVKLNLGAWRFPAYIVESGRSYDDELRYLVYEKGLARRKMELTPVVQERIDYELMVIKNKGYAPYFLVVSDLLRHAHENKILTTIRGSVAGSIVTYLAGITNVDPIAYKLPFERFLNPERPSAPDIDMDYADNRRDEMIEYAKRTYGADKVAQIGTFGTMMARGAVRDVARAMGFPYALADTISKLIPMGSQGFPMTIDKALETTPDLKALYDKDEDTRTIIDMAKKIEGCARHISVHAAGVVIAPTALTDFTPLQLDTKGEAKIITQFDMHAVEDAGLLKFDFLGIKNLSILSDAVQRVEEAEGIHVDIENIPLDDKKTFNMLAKGETIGLFQLNGTGMTRFLKELRPSSIHDINAMVALYRPGPMESIPQYIERKHKPILVQYLDPRMKDILSQSFGVITYQDDVMLIAIHLAGYSWLEADKLRKAMGKKIPAEMEAQKEKLMKGLLENGMTQEKADQLWKLIEPFAAYGFNKAHAASYGRVAYQTSYMKANFPAIYMSAVLTADSGDTEKIAEIIAECKRMGIEVLPPDINESLTGFAAIKGDTVENGERKDKIRFGLTTIKNFGEGIAAAIIEERKRGGQFKSLADFLERVTDKNLNKKSLESLIKAGALDAFSERGKMLANLEYLLEYHKEHSTGKNHDSLFSGELFAGSEMDSLRMVPAPEATLPDKLMWEKELLGLYISGHPLDMHGEAMKKSQMTIKDVKENLREGMQAVVYGLLESANPFLTKKGDKMFFLKIADYTSSIEAVVFPKLAKEFADIIIPDTCIAIKGRLSMRNGVHSVVVDKMKKLGQSTVSVQPEPVLIGE